MQKPVEFYKNCSQCESYSLDRKSGLTLMGTHKSGHVVIPYFSSECKNCGHIAYSYLQPKTLPNIGHSIRRELFGSDNHVRAIKYPFDMDLWIASFRSNIIMDFMQTAPKDIIHELMIERSEQPQDTHSLSTIQ